MIREYCEEYPVEIIRLSKLDGDHYKHSISEDIFNSYMEERLVILAHNEGHYNCTEVDLVDVLKYVKENMKDLWDTI